VRNGADWRGREPIAADGTQDRRVKRRISCEPAIEVLAKIMMAVEFVDKLKDNPRTQPVDYLNLVPAP
jgi:hypothetical protein